GVFSPSSDEAEPSPHATSNERDRPRPTVIKRTRAIGTPGGRLFAECTNQPILAEANIKGRDRLWRTIRTTGVGNGGRGVAIGRERPARRGGPGGATNGRRKAKPGPAPGLRACVPSRTPPRTTSHSGSTPAPWRCERDS